MVDEFKSLATNQANVVEFLEGTVGGMRPPFPGWKGKDFNLSKVVPHGCYNWGIKPEEPILTLYFPEKI